MSAFTRTWSAELSPLVYSSKIILNVPNGQEQSSTYDAFCSIDAIMTPVETI